MSEKFNGFSQDEINRVSGNKHKKSSTMETSEYLNNLHFKMR